MSDEYRSTYGLENHGFENLEREYWNLPTPALYEQVVRHREGILAHHGAIHRRGGPRADPQRLRRRGSGTRASRRLAGSGGRVGRNGSEHAPPTPLEAGQPRPSISCQVRDLRRVTVASGRCRARRVALCCGHEGLPARFVQRVRRGPFDGADLVGVAFGTGPVRVVFRCVPKPAG